MASAIRHRGPDDDGVWLDGSTGFAHRRLSIIDVEKSTQPMESSSGRTTICFNGEILNYQELRKGLAYPFVTRGDTETLLALYERFGIAMLEKLRGQYAFGLVDGRSGDLWLVRDRVGILPLYYFQNDRFFAFASEIKALFPILPEAPRLNESSVDAYLSHRSVPAPSTLFAGVQKVRPGEYLRIPRSGAIFRTRYWRIPAFRPSEITADDAVDRVEAALIEAVGECLVADVPVGAYLSGGVDSSLIVALTARVHSDEVNTFSAGFGDARYDETPFARQVSQALGTRHHEVLVTPDDFLASWERLTWYRDAPLSEPADVAVYKLAELARERVKVVLSGEGSDELFGGYPKHRLAQLTHYASKVPAGLRSHPLSAAERLMPKSMTRARIAARALGASSRDAMYEGWFAPFTEQERSALLGKHLPTTGSRERSEDPLFDMLANDIGGWLPDNLLERGDRMSMAASLELRPPFLDSRVVDLSFALPSNVKVHNGSTKWVVKEVARRYLPREIVDRKKVGFRVPLNDWFREGLNEQMRSLLLDRGSLTADIFDRRAIDRLVRSHESGRRDESIRIWTLVSLEVWSRLFLSGTSGHNSSIWPR